MRRMTLAAVGMAVIAGVFVAAAMSQRAANPPAKAPASRPAPKYAAAMLEAVPHVKQKPDFCGEACVEMVLRKLGHKISQDDVFEASTARPIDGRGCYTQELLAAMEAVGFKSVSASAQIDPAKVEAEMERRFAALHADLTKGIASVVCMRYDEKPQTTEHFRLIVGYDPKTDEVVYHEPAAADGAYKRMTRGRLLSLWPLKYTVKLWTVIRLRCEPGRIVAPAAVNGPTKAAMAQHVRELKARTPKDRGFRMIVEKPFVVIGDERPRDGVDLVEHRARSTVRWAVQRLMAEYFDKYPEEIIDIWLFRDAASYTKHALELFGDTPSTPYGYYSSEHDALVMNISTGGGTLVHEIVHPFVAANFPKCPSWLNEGLGSLYEQSSERDGRIIGLTNWRLAGLQKAIRAKSVPSFKELTGTTTNQFYRMDRGTNYAQARYLCYYLQEQGKLQAFYKAFVAAVDRDPTGYATLQKTLGVKDMEAFKTEWEAWVMKLRFP